MRIGIEHDSEGQAIIIAGEVLEECALCDMDASMQSDLELCHKCGRCLHWEDEFGAGRCCRCEKKSTQP